MLSSHWSNPIVGGRNLFSDIQSHRRLDQLVLLPADKGCYRSTDAHEGLSYNMSFDGRKVLRLRARKLSTQSWLVQHLRWADGHLDSLMADGEAHYTVAASAKSKPDGP